MRHAICKHYLLINFAIILLLLLLASQVIYSHATRFEYLSSEQTIIERAQDVLLLLMAAVGTYAVVMLRQYRELFVAVVAVTLMMLLREQNNWFKSELFSGAWQLCVLAVLLPTAIWLFPRRRRFTGQLKAALQSSAGGIGVAGVLVLLVFSRLLGRKAIWQGVMGEHFVYSVKAVMEESSEMLGYSLMFGALLSLVLLLRTKSALQSNA